MKATRLKRALPQAAVIGSVLGLAIGALTYEPADGIEDWPDGATTAMAGAEATGAMQIPSAPRDGVADPAARSEPVARTVEVKSGDTMLTLLADAGLGDGDARDVVQALRPVYNPRAIRSGQRVELILAPVADAPAAHGAAEMALQRLVIPVAFDLDVAVERTDAGYEGRKIQKEFDVRNARMGATISSSLFDAANWASIPRSVVLELIRIYSFDVDFQRDIQRGDRFEVVFERYYDESGAVAAEGKVQYAALTLSGTTKRLFRYQRPDGTYGYFNEKGESAQKALMKTPVDGARLSSGFGPRRHPILGYTRMHRGIDFAAPSGTPIMAAGSGVIETAGRNAGYGNYVRIRHNSEYATAYAHMSRFARGIRAGKRVEQGDIIGYVGSTGLSSGPHLHYEILYRGKQTNPLSLRLPTAKKLDGKEFERFKAHVAGVETLIASLPTETRVASR